MIKVQVGDLFSSQAQTLVNSVNCVGIMGKGIALEFKKRFPDMYKDYVARCDRHEVKLGRPYVFRHLLEPWVLNFPTKGHWRAVSRLEDIESGLAYLERHCESWGISSLAVPPLGCGEGQLEWRVVGPVLYRRLSALSIPVTLFAPLGTAKEQLELSFLSGSTPDSVQDRGLPYRVSPGWFAVMEILHRLEREPYRPPVGRTTFQKLTYFATIAGIGTSLHFERGNYGPFSPALKRSVTALVNNGLLREEQLGKMFEVRVGSAYESARPAYASTLQEWSDQIDKVADLFLRMNSQQAEIAATVHFVAAEAKRHGTKPSESEVLDAVLEWKRRRQPALGREVVATSVRHLNMLSWLGLTFSEDLPVLGDTLLHT